MESSISIPFFYSQELNENQLNVLIIDDDSKEKNIVSFRSHSFSDDVSFGMQNLINALKENGYPLYNCMIFWFNVEQNNYIYIGNDPIPIDLYIYFSPMAMNKVVLKYRKPYIGNVIYDTLNDQMLKDESIDSKLKENAGRRAKERKIGNVVEKVAIWRKLFSGICIRGKNTQMSLETAANQVGLSKKTLDDYLMQIRLGKKFGFNFNAHYNEKVGVLRKFNKMKRSEKEEEKE